MQLLWGSLWSEDAAGFERGREEQRKRFLVKENVITVFSFLHWKKKKKHEVGSSGLFEVLNAN